MKKSIVVYFAHLSLQQSVINRKMIKAISDMPEVDFRDLHNLYPDFFIDVAAEQEILRNADLIVFQHPIYWYSAPAIFKHLLDTVFLKGFAYGTDGIVLQNKDFLLAVSTGASKEEYCSKGIHHYPINELIRPLEQTARFCGMNFLTPFVIHGGHELSDRTVSDHAVAYKQLIEDYISNKHDI